MNHGTIDRLESILARELQPRLNSIRGTREYLATERIINL